MHNSKPCTYCRGQVWMRKNYTNVNKNSSIQEGSRPVLIISSDDGNATSPLVTTIPITSENKPDILINVRIYNESGERNTVLCNQICPTNKEDLISYQYTVSHKDMIRIDKGIMLSLGLNDYIGNWDMVRSFDRLTDTLKVIVKDRVDEMLNKKHDQLSVGDINKYVDKLLSERDDSSNTETDLAAEEDHEEGTIYVPPHKYKYSKISLLDNYADTNRSVGCNIMKDALKGIVLTDTSSDMVPKKEVNTSKDNSDKSCSTRKWTIELCRQFINDRGKLSMNDMMSKYNMDKSMIFRYTYYCKKKLEGVK